MGVFTDTPHEPGMDWPGKYPHECEEIPGFRNGNLQPTYSSVTVTLRFGPGRWQANVRADGRQKARTVCTIGTQPVIPAVYGVKAPL